MKGKFLTFDECLQQSEIKALKKLNHKNIIKLKEVSRKNDEMFIVYEYCENNLYQEIQKRAKENKPFSEDEIRDIMQQALQSIAYTH